MIKICGQGKGIGCAMMEQAMARIHSYLQPGQSAMVNLMAAKDKEPFYKKFGFVERPNDNSGGCMVQIIKPNQQVKHSVKLTHTRIETVI